MTMAGMMPPKTRLEAKTEDVEAEIGAVKAALELAALEKPKHDDVQSLVAAAGTLYGAHWSRDELKGRLTALTTEKNLLLQEKNLLLQERIKPRRKNTHCFCFSCLQDVTFKQQDKQQDDAAVPAVPLAV